MRWYDWLMLAVIAAQFAIVCVYEYQRTNQSRPLRRLKNHPYREEIESAQKLLSEMKEAAEYDADVRRERDAILQHLQELVGRPKTEARLVQMRRKPELMEQARQLLAHQRALLNAVDESLSEPSAELNPIPSDDE